MDGPQFLDGLVGSLTGILNGGYDRLAPEIKRLFEILVGLDLILAALAWCAAYLEAFQRWALSLIKLFIWAMIFTSYPVLTVAFQNFCIESGLLAGGLMTGGDLTVEEFKKPSTVMMKGFQATAPINKFIQRHTGWAAMKNFWNLGMMSLGALGLWLAFVVMSVHLVFVQLIFAVVVAFGFAFVIFGVLGITNFLAERAFGLIVASAARLGVAALWTGLAFPFIEQFGLDNFDPAADPDIYVGAWILIGAWIISLFSVMMPAIAHSFFAGGPMLSLNNLIPGLSLIRGGRGSSGGGGARTTNVTNTNVVAAVPQMPVQAGNYL
jgi:type IV secretory pathway TrbL component